MRAIALSGFLVVLLAACSSEPNEEAQSNVEIRGSPIDSPAPATAASTAPADPSPDANELDPTPALESPASVESANAAPTPPPAAEAQEASGEEFVPVTFDKLAGFHFEMPTDPASTNETEVIAKDQIPSTIKALDQRKIALRGFMLPLKVESGLVTEMLIMRDQSMCCYGTIPKINEWVSVKMVEKGVKPVMDQPVTLFGTLHVGEMRENGYLVGIYRMDGEEMAGPLDF